MKSTNSNLRTTDQNKKLYWLFTQLNIRESDQIADLVFDFTNGRTTHTSELTFIECRDLIKSLYRLYQGSKATQSEMIDRQAPDSPVRRELDRKRKGVIKAIFRWFELQGKDVSMDYVKAVACRASGVSDFNKISSRMLGNLYAEFCRKQRIGERMKLEGQDLPSNN